jgi:DHA1 family multidrug resistance protein-like MFS transporter
MEYWRKNLYVLWGTQFLAMAGMNLVVPFLPFYVRQLGVTDPDDLARWSGLIFAGPFFTAFLSTPFWGSLGDKYGRKMMVVRAIIGLGIAQVFIGFSQNVYQLLFFRILQGAISGFIAATLALVSTTTPKEKMGYALGLLQSATAGGTVLGPAIGGVLADMIGFRPIFFVTAGLCIAGGVVVAIYVQTPGEKRTPEQPSSVLQNYRYMFRDSQLRLVAFAIFIAQAAALMIEPIFALFVEGFQTDTTYIATIAGVVFAIAGVFMVISAPWWGRRNDRFGFKRSLILTFAGTGVAYALHPLVPNIYLLCVLRAGLGFVRGGILHALYSVTSLRSPQERRSGLIGIASSLAILGNMVGPLLGGLVASHGGIAVVFIVNSALFLGTALLLSRSFIELPARTTPPVPETLEVVE